MGTIMRTSEFYIPLKVKPKGRPRFNGRIAYTDKATRDFELDVKTMLNKIYTGQPLQGPIAVQVKVFFETPKRTQYKYPPRCDCDNLFKSIADACNELLWEDDSQIVKMQCSKSWSDHDHFIISIAELNL
jgi:Holliday junction resolvase RusA-like endonuclease